MVAVTLSTSGKPSINLNFADKHPDQVTVKDLKLAVQAKFPKYVPNRQRITIPPPGGSGKSTALTDEDRSIGSYGVSEGSKLRLKDLGKQVPYRTLYLWEYVGPIFLNPLFLHFSYLLWGPYTPSTLQLAVRNLTIIHFLKRFLESIFVHSFSRPTLPLAYVFRNSLYYWGVNGLLIGLTFYRPGNSASALKGTIYDDPRWIYGWTTWILINEALNLYTHLHLASLRTPPGHPRKFPTGFGFGTVVCANYWFETLQVLGTVAITGGDPGSLVYLVISTYFMQLWAGQKYARYKKEFDPKIFPGKRWKMFPPIY
ncbi:3-oxo-5-alpha-steroid 4-dehydrogenase-domain-containing protein [Naematelia encephala]|uniref:3-oxo-5-alpha-steroid 4-dehydrogenase-domain-containing protein n=1 Tax=Naematelia encephala TaxID=71784 RepID=A0A1Y2BJN6_9TREE|nr:3-oxo-5-alpha-steroid 4-dehydrogenase-domain-containing protein [Naematelia encephala]